MNKYQKYLVGDLSKNSYLSNCDSNVWIEDKFVLKQNEDIALKDYVLHISNETFEAIFAAEGDTQKPFKKTNNQFCIPIDFEHKFDSIKIVFKNNLADDLILPVEYVEADKEAYYIKKEKEHKENLLKAAEIKVSTGTDLVNIYFQPCCDKYDYTEIQLYIPKNFVTAGGPYGPVKKPSEWSLIKKSKVDTDEFYKSIGGLANGKYSFVLRQFDKNGNVLLKTDYMEFSIKSGTNGPHRHTVII